MTDRSLGRAAFDRLMTAGPSEGVDVVRSRHYNFRANTINLSANYAGIMSTAACNLAESVTIADRKNHYTAYAA